MRLFVYSVAAGLALALPAAAVTNDWYSTSSGFWTNNALWSLGAYPGSAGRTDDEARFTNNPAVHYTVSLSAADVGGALTNRTLELLDYVRAQVNLSGWPGSPLRFVLHNAGAAAARHLKVGQWGILNLSNVDLSITGTDPTIEFVDINAALLSATNSKIVLENSGVVNALRLRRGGSLSMAGGELVVTNPARTARLGSADGTFAATFTNTKLDLDHLDTAQASVPVVGGPSITLDCGALATTGTIRLLTMATDALVTFRGGMFQIGAVAYGGEMVGASRLVVTGSASVDVTNAIFMESTVSPYSNTQYVLTIAGSGSVTAAALYMGGNQGGQPVYPDMHLANLNDDGCLTLNGVFMIGCRNGSRNGPGKFIMTGGRLIMANPAWGVSNAISVGSPYADGRYIQTGGTAFVGRVILYTDNSAADTNDYGAETFVVASNATLMIRGDGLVRSSTNAWLPGLLTASNLNFDGTVVLDPAPGASTSQLPAFCREIGAVREGLTNDFVLNRLDLSAMDGSEVLTVVAAGNVASNALYIRRLDGLTPATAAAHLQSAINVYYDPDVSPSMGYRWRIPLAGGGRLIALPTGRRGTFFLAW